MKEGPQGGSLNVLTETDTQRIHSTSISLLWECGTRSESDLILDLFVRAGAHVDRPTRLIRVPADMIDAARSAAPKSFVIYGREPQYDLLAEAGRAYYGMGGSPEPSIFDYDLGQRRALTKADMVRCTRVGHALSDIDFIMALCSAGDMPQGTQYFHEYDAIFRNATSTTT